MRNRILTALLLTTLTLLVCCQPSAGTSTPDYPVTVLRPADTATARPTASSTPEQVNSPTFDWGIVTLLPDPESAPTATVEATGVASGVVPDPLTEADLALLAPGRGPFEIGDVEASLGRILLPVDLLAVSEQGAFQVTSIPVDNHPNWRFLAFDLPQLEKDQLGEVVRAPIGGLVMDGTMQMVNDQIVQTISIDHPIGDNQVLRATLVYSGSVELLNVMQQVETGQVLFRLTHDTGRLETLGSTPIPGGATMTLHMSIDSVTAQESGVETLKFLRGVSLTPAGFLKDEQGELISPTD